MYFSEEEATSVELEGLVDDKTLNDLASSKAKQIFC